MNRKWTRFVVRRSLRLVLVLASIVVVTFALIHVVPGDPARAIAGAHADPAAVERAHARLGLDQPILTQLGDYVSGLAHLDLGDSYVTKEPVTKVIADRAGATAEIAILGFAIVFMFGLPLGLAAGVLSEHGLRRFEVGFSGISGVMASLPDYLIATVLAFVFAVTLHWLPVAGAATLAAAILPAIAISVRPSAMVARLVRVQTQEVLQQDYIRAARSKRLPTRVLLARHVLPNSLTAALSIGGIVFAGLIGGAIVVEQVFARPGLGTELVQSILVKDYPVVQGITLVLGVTVVLVNAAMDIVMALVDPRTLEGEQ